MAVPDSLNRVKYSALDFATAEDEILTRLQVKFAATYNDFNISALAIMLIDIFAFGMDTLSFYLDRRATDNFLTTGRTRKSVARAARQLGYKMGGAVASSVDVQVALEKNDWPFDITIPIGFRFKGPNNLVFEAQESALWQKGDQSTIRNISCSEGTTQVATFVSTGLPNQVFNIAGVPTGKFIVAPGTDGASRVSVVVDGLPWQEVEILYFDDSIQNQFEIGYNDSPPTVRFGDGVAGSIPPVGAEILLTYFSSSGLSGRVEQGTITDVVSPLIINFNNIGMTVNNPLASVGGDDPEDIAKAKSLAPLIYKSRDVNVTAPDYQARALRFRDPMFGAVAAAQAISVKSSAEDAYLNSKTGDINAEALNYSNTVNDLAAQLSAGQTDIATQVTAAQSALAAIQSAVGTITTNLSSLSTSTLSVKTAAAATSAAAASLNYAVSSIPQNAAADGLKPATAANINALISVIISQANLSDPGSIPGYHDSISSANTTISNNLVTAQNAITKIGSDQVTALAYINELTTASGDVVYNINTDTANILDHVGSFLSDEGKANLIEVPILAIDADGFYMVPTVGLVKSLQQYLDKKKEVSQVVKVIADPSRLLPADIEITYSILTGYVDKTIRSQIQSAVYNVLRRRDFGATLGLDEIYEAIDPQVSGIRGLKRVNVRITGPVANLDDKGNLVPSPVQVVTRGSITLIAK